MSSGEESATEDVNPDLETIVEGGEEQETVEVQRDNDDDNEDAEKTVVKPKRVHRNPQPLLNDQTLKGPRGIEAVEGYFERVKFKGHGYEEQDLNALLKTYEYWCHRLFPKFPFDSCVAKLETLGNKKSVQTQIKRIRFNLHLNEEENKDVDNEAENSDEEIIQNDPFDQLLPQNYPVPVEVESEVTEEQLERMRHNKERALRLRQERLQKMKAQTESRQLPSNSQNVEVNDGFPTAEETAELNRDSEEEIDDMLEEINSEKITKDKIVAKSSGETKLTSNQERLQKIWKKASSNLDEPRQLPNNSQIGNVNNGVSSAEGQIEESEDINSQNVIADKITDENVELHGTDNFEEQDIEEMLDDINSSQTEEKSRKLSHTNTEESVTLSVEQMEMDADKLN